MKSRLTALCAALTALAACSTTVTQQGTLAELETVEADLDEVYLEDSLERAAQSYRRYLNETKESARTPEAMRRLADLQIEQAYGVIGSGTVVEMAAPEAPEAADAGSVAAGMAAPETARATGAIVAERGAGAREPSESDAEFEDRALMKAFGESGCGVFTSPSAVEEDVVEIEGEAVKS